VSTLDDVKRRILAVCPPDQLPIVDFELRMLVATLESESLTFIHQHWRPIADERDQLRQLLAVANAKPPRDRSAKVADDADLPARFGALTNDHTILKRKYDALQTRHETLQNQYDVLLEEKTETQTELALLQLAHKKLQADCDDLLADHRPARNAS
jgi:hypothetical protein